LAEFERYKTDNNYKMQAGLEKFVIPILAATSAYILDFITDYTCDSWSLTCRQFSKIFAMVYYIVSLVVGYKFWCIYRKQGYTAVGISAFNLGEAALKRVQTTQEKLLHHRKEHKAKEKSQ